MECTEVHILLKASSVGKEFKEQIIFVHMDSDIEDQQPIMEFLGVKETNLALGHKDRSIEI